jgi:uncharacterized protein YggE
MNRDDVACGRRRVRSEYAMKRSLLVILLVSSFALAGPVGFAQVVADPVGITVTGSGSASVPAESAEMEIVLSDFDAYMGMPTMPQAEATPGAEASNRVAPVVAALDRIDGVESVEVVYPPVMSPYQPSPYARLTLAISSPDSDLMQEITTTTVQAAAGGNLMVSYIGALFRVADCETLERDARAAALADAQRLAGIQADVMGAGLGEVVSVASDPYSFYPAIPASGCDSTMPGMTYSGDPMLGATLPAFDPTRDAAEVTVYRMLRVTFAIGDAVATPAA